MSSEFISSLTSVSLNNDHVNDGRGAENVAAEKELQTETEQQLFFMILFCSNLVMELTNSFFFWLHVSHTAQHHPPGLPVVLPLFMCCGVQLANVTLCMK